MRCGSGRRALTGGGGRAEPAVFGGWGARRFLVDIWGLAESLVPAYTNSSIFCEKLRSGDAGERDSVSGVRGIFCPGAGERDSVSGVRGIFCPGAGERDSVSGERGIFCPGAGERDSVSGERGSSSGVSGDCDVLSWLPRLFSNNKLILIMLSATKSIVFSV